MSAPVQAEVPLAAAAGHALAPTLGRKPRQLIIGLAIAAAVLGGGLAVPHVVTDAYTMGLAVDAALLSMLALSIGFLARHLGLISLGHTAFFGGSAYMVGIASTHWGWGPLSAVIAGVVAGTGLAVVMGILVVRASGMGFLMLTLALSQMLYELSIQTAARPITGAYDGLLISYDKEQTFLGLTQRDLMDPGLFWPLVWISLVVVTVVLWLLGRARFGTVLEGIRENDERMRFSGYNTFGPRLAAFVLTGAVASLAGALFALNAGYVSPEVLGFLRAGDSLMAAIIGGLGTLVGPVLGAALFVFAQGKLNMGGNLHLYIGLTLVGVLVFLPGGITGTAQRAYRAVRRSAAARRRPTAQEREKNA